MIKRLKLAVSRFFENFITSKKGITMGKTSVTLEFDKNTDSSWEVAHAHCPRHGTKIFSSEKLAKAITCDGCGSIIGYDGCRDCYKKIQLDNSYNFTGIYPGFYPGIHFRSCFLTKPGYFCLSCRLIGVNRLGFGFGEWF